MNGILYVCPTPIGNLKDITLRTLEVLQSVDLIACEDTRQTLKLLTHYEIKKPLTSYFEHNKLTKGDYIISKLLQGENVALVSDAGMPGISDPGYELIQQALAAGISYTVLPGASASVTALVLSGLPNSRFCFEGFLPKNKKERTAVLQKLQSEERTMIFYESPHHLIATLEDFAQIFPARQMAICRELSKKFEEVCRGSVEELLTDFNERDVKGEFVLVVNGATPIKEESKDIPWAIARTNALIEQGIREKDAIKQAAQEAMLPKRDVYNAFVKEK